MKQIEIAEDNLLDMQKIGNDFFSIIPGIENASILPTLMADEINETIFIRDWVNNNKPCLVKGAVKHWPAMQLWKNKSYWKTACENFNIYVYPHQNYNNKALNQEEEMPFYDAIERLFQKSDPVFSMPSEAIDKNNRFAGLVKDVTGFTFLPEPAKPRIYNRTRMFMYRRASTAWHYHDVDETLMCQVEGAKRIVLFSPNIRNAAYVTDFLHQECYLEGIKLASKDLKPIIVDVEKGDALYIPPYWHHGVVPKDSEVGFTVAYCWASPLHKFGDFSNYFVRRLYRDALWPIKKISLVMPFLACYSAVADCSRKLRKLLTKSSN